MFIKFKKNINEYNYILSFDIAKFKTGWSLFDVKNYKVVDDGLLDLSKDRSETIWLDYYNGITEIIKHCIKESEGNLLLTKERLPNQNGKFTTIDTLQALAQAHVVCDLAAQMLGVDCYDEYGVHSISVKAYFKSITGLEKPSKNDIKDEINKQFPNYIFNNEALDVTDSIAVVLTLLDVKYNKDIKDEIKNIKREIKASKTNKKIEELQGKINALQLLLLDENA